MAKHKHRDAIVLRPHHRKPYRIHHLGLLIFSLLLVIIFAIELGIVIGHDQSPTVPKPVTGASRSGQISIKSGYGFAMDIDSSSFVVATTKTSPEAISKVVITSKPGTSDPYNFASAMSIEVNPDKEAFAAAKADPQNNGLTDGQIAQQLLPQAEKARLNRTLVSSSSDTLNGVPVHKNVNKYTLKNGSGDSYTVSWYGAVGGRAFVVSVAGIVGSQNIPAKFTETLKSLKISGDQAVLGASTNIFASSTTSFNGKLDSKYLSDAVSPAVVQIYHSVCGVLTYQGRAVGSSSCTTMTGSGFLATSDGYIATNGHVVVYSAKDALANLVTSNDANLQSYLSIIGLTPDQITAARADTPTLAAIIGKIYDLPQDQLSFSSKGEMLLVSIGKDQPKIPQLAAIKTSDQLLQFNRDTDSIKTAKLIGYNYSAKDKFTAIADPAKGYTASDVALIKINVANAPTIPISTAQVVQNQKIVLMGFPGDASNPLIDNTYTDVTVTDGVISAIRAAAGGKAQLYQSDVDASHGNSGGPAIDDQGKAIGLLTYRYVDSQNGNSPKSYIRAIEDFVDLAKNEAVPINSASKTSAVWLAGLENYSNRHYSAALKDFNEVYQLYPSQRLVGNYIYSSKKAIAAGEDVKDLPVRTLVIALALSITVLTVTVYLIIRHNGLHKVYQVSQKDQFGAQRAVVLSHPHDQS